MTSPDQPKKRGFLNTFAQAIAPQAPTGDDAAKAKRPTTVVIALVLATLGGALFLFNAGTRYFSLEGEDWEANAADYRAVVSYVNDQCTSAVGGIGDAVTGEATAPLTLTPPLSTGGPQTVEQTAVAAGCRNQSTPDEVIDGFKSEQTYVAIGELIIGLLAIVGAFLMRNGSVPLRRLLLASVGFSLVLSLMVSTVSTPYTLIASLFMVAGLVLSYVGKGGGWFMYQTAGRAKH